VYGVALAASVRGLQRGPGRFPGGWLARASCVSLDWLAPKGVFDPGVYTLEGVTLSGAPSHLSSRKISPKSDNPRSI